MPKKKDDLNQVINTFMTMGEASEWIEQHREELGLTRPINTDTLKKACYQGRLKAALKGGIYLTRETELRQYLKTFDPKNKTERTPLKPRAIQHRVAKVAQPTTEPVNEQLPV